MKGAHVFNIGHDVYAALKEDEVLATVEALKECDLYRLPFDRVAMRFLLSDYCRLKVGRESDWKKIPRSELKQNPDGTFSPDLGPHHMVEVRNVNLRGEPIAMVFVHDGSDKGFKAYELDYSHDYDAAEQARICASAANVLIVLLATRNAHKETRVDKLARLGIGKASGKHRYEYTTTITLPAVQDMPDDAEHPPGPGAGVAKCPHLRRAHVRNVPYGPGRQFRRPRLIEAVFVNADREWTKTRVAYNVTGGTR